MDYFGGDDALGDVDVDVKEIFSAEEAVNFGRKVTRVSVYVSIPLYYDVWNFSKAK